MGIMSTSAPEPGRAPDANDAAALAARAAEAAANSTSAEQARENVAEAVRQEAENRGVEFSDADIDRMTDALIRKLAERGAWDNTPDPAPPSPASADGSSPTPQPADGSTQPPAPAPDANVETPKRKSFAERFNGQ
jgi:hypothetical protein